jgi:prepilin-type N-terminal cleavage/methylation domain-containing protein
MKSKKGFTLIELMVVILIVAILAAVAIPIMRGRIDAAKWSEGRAIMGSIATAIRAYAASEDAAPATGTLDDADLALSLGFAPADLDGTYFDPADFDIDSCTYDPNSQTPLVFSITGTKAALHPASYTLTNTGAWSSN